MLILKIICECLIIICYFGFNLSNYATNIPNCYAKSVNICILVAFLKSKMAAISDTEFLITVKTCMFNMCYQVSK